MVRTGSGAAPTLQAIRLRLADGASAIRGRGELMVWLPLVAGIAIMSLYVFYQAQPERRLAYEYDGDEGVYLQSAWAMLRGQRPFAEIFMSQPPFVLAVFAGAFSIFGVEVGVARMVVVCFSLAAIAGVGLVAARHAPWAGVCAAALMAFDPVFDLNAIVAQPGVTATAMAALAVGCVARATPATRFRNGWLLAAGVTFAIATLSKLTGLVAVAALGVAILASRRPGRGIADLARDLTLCGAPVLLAWGIVLVAYTPQAVVDQLLLFRTVAAETNADEGLGNGTLLMLLLRNDPLPWIAAGIGAVALGARRQWWVLGIGVVWLASALAAVASYTPLFSHHLVVLLPPLMVLGGSGLYETARGLLRIGRLQLRRQAQFSFSTIPYLVALGAFGFAATTVPGMHEVRTGRVPDLVSPAALSPVDDIRAVEETVPPDQLVVTDAQMIAFRAHRAVPAELVDTSGVRVGSGYLTGPQVLAIIERDRPAAVLFSRGKFDRLPEVRQWVEEHYRRMGHGRGLGLYVRPDNSG